MVITYVGTTTQRNDVDRLKAERNCLRVAQQTTLNDLREVIDGREVVERCRYGRGTAVTSVQHGLGQLAPTLTVHAS